MTQNDLGKRNAIVLLQPGYCVTNMKRNLGHCDNLNGAASGRALGNAREAPQSNQGSFPPPDHFRQTSVAPKTTLRFVVALDSQ